MSRLLDARGDEAIELLADLMDPVADIAADPQVVRCIETGQNVKAVKFALKDHAKAVREMLAACAGVPAEEYQKNVIEMATELLAIVNNPDVAQLFTTQVQTEAPVSGPVTEATEAH